MSTTCITKKLFKHDSLNMINDNKKSFYGINIGVAHNFSLQLSSRGKCSLVYELEHSRRIDANRLLYLIFILVASVVYYKL